MTHDVIVGKLFWICISLSLGNIIWAAILERFSNNLNHAHPWDDCWDRIYFQAAAIVIVGFNL